jgi:hypothetical protein
MKIFAKKHYTEDEMRNIGLDLSMEFGPNWLKPLQERLSHKIPNLTSAELDSLDRECRSVRDEGIQDLHYMLEEIDPKQPKDKNVVYAEFSTNQMQKHPWINKKNMDHLFSQAMYYAFKDGNGVGCVK